MIPSSRQIISGVCGEMAGRTLGAAALITMGVEELSAGPGALPRIRRLVQLIAGKRLRTMAPDLRCTSGASEVRALLKEELLNRKVPPSLWAGE